MINLKFNNGIVEDFTIVLCTRDYKRLGQLNGLTDCVYNRYMNSANEITFTVHKHKLTSNVVSDVKEYQENLWNNIIDFKLVWIKELDEYFEIKTPLNDSSSGTSKLVTARSLCEAELSQTNLYNLEINTIDDIDNPSYDKNFPTLFYRNPDNFDEYDEIWNSDTVKYFIYKKDENGNLALDDSNNYIVDTELTYELRRNIIKQSSLLHRILDKAQHYTIKHVDSTIVKLQRTFTIDGTSIYDFMIGECSEQFNCLFVFDSRDRSISVYDLYNTCTNIVEKEKVVFDDNGNKSTITVQEECGKRGEFDVCPYCGNTNLVKGYGKDTTIFIDKTNLTEEINCEVDTDNVKNCFKLEAGDDDMTAAIRMLNQNGSDYIYNLTDYQYNDMPKELLELLEKYNVDYMAEESRYQNLVENYYNLVNDKLYYESSMMPSTTIEQENISASTEVAKLTVDNLSPIGLEKLFDYTTVYTVNNAVLNYAKVFVKTGYVKLEIDMSDETKATFTYNKKGDDGYNYGTWTGRFVVTNYSDEEDVVYSPVITIEINDNIQYFINQKVLKELSNSSEDDSYDVLSIDDIDIFKEKLTLYSLNRLTSFEAAIDGALNVMQQMEIGVPPNKDKDQSEYTTHELLHIELYQPYVEKLNACTQEISIRNGQISEIQSQIDSVLNEINSIQDKLNFEKYLGNYYPIFCAYRREDKYTNSNYIIDGLDDTDVIKKSREFIELAREELYKSSRLQTTISSTLYNLLLIKQFKPLVDYFEVGNWIRIKIDDTVYKLRLMSYTINFGSLQTIDVEFSNVSKIKNVVSDTKSILESAKSMGSSFSTVSKQAEQGSESAIIVNSWAQEGLNAALTRIKNNTNEEVVFNKYGLLCRSYDDITETYSDEQLKVTSNIIVFTNDNWNTAKQAIGKHDYITYNSESDTWTTQTDYGMTSQFVTAGQISGSTIVGGEIYSRGYSKANNIGSYINLETGDFSFGGGKFILDTKNNTLTLNDGKIVGGYLLIGDTTKVGAYAEITNTGVLNCNGANINGVINATGGEIGGLTITETYLSSSNEDGNTIYISPTQIQTKGRDGLSIHEDYYSVYYNNNQTTHTSISYNGILTKGSVDFLNNNGSAFVGRITSNGILNSSTGYASLDWNGNGDFKTAIISSGATISGGAIISGGVNLSTTRCIYSDANNSNIFIGVGNKVTSIGTSGTYRFSDAAFLPGANNYSTLGNSNYKWSTIYASSSTIETSDRNKKDNVEPISDLYQQLFMKLLPSSYTFKDGSSGRTHVGFISQDVEEAMTELGMTGIDFAGFCKDLKTKPKTDGTDGEELDLDENGNEQYIYSLRYGEFVALNTHMIQQLYKRVKELETKLEQFGV